jgi:hypothetical protein
VLDFVTAISEETLRTCDLPTPADALAGLPSEPEGFRNSPVYPPVYPTTASEALPTQPEWYEPQHGGMQVMESDDESDDDGAVPPRTMLGMQMSSSEDMSRGVPMFPMDPLPLYPSSLPQVGALDAQGLDPPTGQAALGNRGYLGEATLGYPHGPPQPAFSQGGVFTGQMVPQSGVQAQAPVVYSQAQPAQAMTYGQAPHAMHHSQAHAMHQGQFAQVGHEQHMPHSQAQHAQYPPATHGQYMQQSQGQPLQYHVQGQYGAGAQANQAQPYQAMSAGPSTQGPAVPNIVQGYPAQSNQAISMGQSIQGAAVPNTVQGYPGQSNQPMSMGASTQGLGLPNPVQGYPAQVPAHFTYGGVQALTQGEVPGQPQSSHQAPQETPGQGTQWHVAAQQGLQGNGLYPGQSSMPQSQAYPTTAQAQPLRAHAVAPSQGYPPQHLPFSMQYPVQAAAPTQGYPTDTSQPQPAPGPALMQQNPEPTPASTANPHRQANQVAAHVLGTTAAPGVLHGAPPPTRPQQPTSSPASLPLSVGAVRPLLASLGQQQGGARPLGAPAFPTPAEANQPTLASGSVGRQAGQGQSGVAGNQAAMPGLGGWGLAGDPNSVTASFLRMLQTGGIGRAQQGLTSGQPQPNQAVQQANPREI